MEKTATKGNRDNKLLQMKRRILGLERKFKVVLIIVLVESVIIVMMCVNMIFALLKVDQMASDIDALNKSSYIQKIDDTSTMTEVPPVILNESFEEEEGQ